MWLLCLIASHAAETGARKVEWRALFPVREALDFTESEMETALGVFKDKKCNVKEALEVIFPKERASALLNAIKVQAIYRKECLSGLDPKRSGAQYSAAEFNTATIMLQEVLPKEARFYKSALEFIFGKERADALLIAMSDEMQ